MVCEVVNPYTGRVVETGRARMNGYLYAVHYDGVCRKGDRLFGVAIGRKVQPAAYVRRLRARWDRRS